MSKKVSILEGQKGSKFSGVQYLRTNLSGGGVCEWIPEDSVKLTTKRITKNGEYFARSEKDSQNNPYYAFSQVTVAVKNSTTGTKDPSTGGDGNEYSVSTDPDTGMLTEKVLPSKIKIETLPTKLQYLEGETIEMTGSVVKAYKKDGTIWESEGYTEGIIPIEELNLDPSVAVRDSGGVSGGWSTKDGIIDGLPQSVDYIFPSYRATWHFSYTNVDFEIVASGGVSTVISYPSSQREHSIDMIVASLTNDVEILVIRSDSEATRIHGQEWTVEDKTFYVAHSAWWMYEEDASTITGSPNELDANDTSWSFISVAYLMLFGNFIPNEGEITVTWNRPEDFKALTDTFDIEVTPSN